MIDNKISLYNYIQPSAQRRLRKLFSQKTKTKTKKDVKGKENSRNLEIQQLIHHLADSSYTKDKHSPLILCRRIFFSITNLAWSINPNS